MSNNNQQQQLPPITFSIPYIDDSQIHYFDSPVPHFVIDNIFGAEINHNILRYIWHIKGSFGDAVLGSGQSRGVYKEIRYNQVTYLDSMHPGELRQQSPILVAIDQLVKSDKLASYMDSCSDVEMQKFRYVTKMDNQLSRYGVRAGHPHPSHYKWHYDMFIGDSHTRVMTMVYYAHFTPKRFSGGTIALTNALQYGSKILQSPTNKTIEYEPVNDRMVIFSARTVHAVMPCYTITEEFEDGRFSVNTWLGVD